ncbi:hypothetical protein [Deinococcus alpinitundrae]|uniref:hypothetical protein n=1 Tax=Deinococcus alpinitundrae TaxID=468913 RepID=UPI00137B75F2|nr:hypothetical protein [Deinococcus alpinitundrae]
MTQVYLMPKLLIAAGAAALALSGVLYAAAGGNDGLTLSLPVLTTLPMTPSCVRGTAPAKAGITIVSRKDGVTCYTFTDPKFYQGAYLSLTSLKDAVNSQGGTVEILNSGKVRLHLPTSTGMYEADLLPGFNVNSEEYFPAASIATSLYQNQESSVRFQGYHRPTIVVDHLRIQFGNGTQAEVGPSFYRGVVPELLGYILPAGTPGSMLMYRASSSVPVSGGRTHKVTTTLNGDEVAMLVTRRAGQNYDLDVAPVGSNGQVTFSSAQQRLHFVSDPAQLGPDPVGGRINALLMRVTNIPLSNLKSGIFVPAQPNSDAQ